MTFRENEPYYEPTNDAGITLSPPKGQQEGESNSGGNHMGSVLVPPSVGFYYGDNSVHSHANESRGGDRGRAGACPLPP